MYTIRGDFLSNNCNSGFGGGYFGGNLSFPSLREYDGDLRWLICAYQQFGENLQSLIDRIAALENLYESIPQEIQELVHAALLPVYERMEVIEDNMRSWKSEIDNNIMIQDSKLENMMNVITKLEVYVSDIHDACLAYTNEKTNELRGEIYAYLKNIAKEWPPVRCPVDNTLEDINTALLHVFNSLRRGVTYGTFNKHGFSFGQLNSFVITYGEFNKKAEDIFSDKKDKRFYMFSPITGKYVFWTDVINELYRLHFPGVKYGELSNANLLFSDFNEKRITFKNFNETIWL